MTFRSKARPALFSAGPVETALIRAALMSLAIAALGAVAFIA